MTPEVLADTPDSASSVRITIEVAGLREVWESPATESTLQSALVAIEAVAKELRARHELAQELERQLGDGGGNVVETP